MLRANMRVRISGRDGEVIGRVEEVRALSELAPAAREALSPWGVTRMASITYRRSPESQLLVTAVEIDGRWYDLDQHELDIEIVGDYSCRGALVS